MSDIKRHRGPGRLSNEELKSRGLLRKIKSCKICQSPHCDEITIDLLSGMSGEDVRRKYNEMDYFKDKQLNPPNIFSHRKHCNPTTLATIDNTSVIRKQADYSPEVKKLYQQKYDATFNKLSTVDEMYKQRLLNLWELQKELEDLKAKPTDVLVENGGRTPTENVRIHELTLAIDFALHNLTQDVLKHVKVEQGPQKNVNIIFINHIKSGMEQFIEAFVDIIMTEIDDSTLRLRLKDKFIEKLDSIIAPLLDDKKIIDATYEIIEDTKALPIQKKEN